MTSSVQQELAGYDRPRLEALRELMERLFPGIEDQIAVAPAPRPPAVTRPHG